MFKKQLDKAPDPAPEQQTAVGTAYGIVFEHMEQRLTELEDRMAALQARLELMRRALGPVEEMEP